MIIIIIFSIIYTTISTTFHASNQVQHCECLPVGIFLSSMTHVILQRWNVIHSQRNVRIAAGEGAWWVN